MASVGVRYQGQRVRQPVDIDLAIRHTAHVGVALEILDLVEVERSRDKALQGMCTPTSNEVEHSRRRVRAQRVGQERANDPAGDQRLRQLFVVRRTDLLQSVRKWIVSDVMKQRGRPHDGIVASAERPAFALGEQGQRTAGQMVRAQCVLEARMGRAGVHEVRQPQLTHVAQSLHDTGVDQPHREVIDPDVVPQRVADDLEIHAQRFPGSNGVYLVAIVPVFVGAWAAADTTNRMYMPLGAWPGTPQAIK